ncbi:MAG: DUF2254 domain-containing protein [Rhodothermales bacterium]|nr:DUF2254 domain-containing protein [Rhodothermales bacterium]MBO6780599.1 DUF2254 domain-containing protein [Rhodothermales bacterium]
MNLLKYWDRLRSSFWFVPAVMTLAAAGLASGIVSLDRSESLAWLHRLPMIYTGTPEGASSVLSGISSGMITIAGVVFSMTLVALSLASGQFGPRLLRNFMRDTTNQVVLGTFVATFLYCLLVLRSIRFGEGDAAFVPDLAVTLSIVGAVGAMGVLIYFIHHVAISIQADHVVARVGEEFVDQVDMLFPEHLGDPDGDTDPEEEDFDAVAARFSATGDRNRSTVCLERDGYLQAIDAEEHLQIAREADLRIKLLTAPGDYVIAGVPVAVIHPRPDDETLRALRKGFILGRERTTLQDPSFPLDQLVEMAVRALSPGVNDPFTAARCLDRLTSGLVRAGRRRRPSAVRLDAEGVPRVWAPLRDFQHLLHRACDGIRPHTAGSAQTIQDLMRMLATLAGEVRRAEDAQAVREQAAALVRVGRDSLTEPRDLERLEGLYAGVSQTMRIPAEVD